ncbi:MAG: 30S ribosomal protein S15 [Candidatus Pacebacteria bacterium]|nr:30S ribosomal protein S15 [Candidatus Paceibacterota bacterium]
MMLDKQTKQDIVHKFSQHKGDSGSTQVQIAILTEEIKELTEHLKKHRHDFSSRRGLLRKVGERRRLLKYLQKEDESAFLDLASRLNLRIAKKMAAEEEERKRLEAELMAKVNLDVAEEDMEEPDIEALEKDQ